MHVSLQEDNIKKGYAVNSGMRAASTWAPIWFPCNCIG